MDFIKEQFKEYETPDLIQAFITLSQNITALMDKPFCTVRQMEAIENELNLGRITFRCMYEEILTRRLSEEEQTQFAEAVQDNM